MTIYGRRQCNGPIRCRNKSVHPAPSAGKVTIGFGFASDWLKRNINMLDLIGQYILLVAPMTGLGKRKAKHIVALKSPSKTALKVVLYLPCELENFQNHDDNEGKQSILFTDEFAKTRLKFCTFMVLKGIRISSSRYFL